MSPDNPTPGGPPAADGSPASEVRPTPEIGKASKPVANGSHISNTQKRKWRYLSRFRKQLALAGLALIGIAAGIWAMLIFPENQPLEGPPSFSLYLYPKIPLSGVVINIFHQNGNTVIFLHAHPSSANKLSSGDVGNISLAVLGSFPTNCPTGVKCYRPTPYQDYPLTTWVRFPLILNKGEFALYTVHLRDTKLAFAANVKSAIVQLPYTRQDAGSSTTATVSLNYAIPDVQSYDWSTPPELTSQNFGFWIQYPNSSHQNQPGTEITGINHDRQAQDDRDTFISGILLGVVGAATIAVVQEGLHMLFDERREKTG